MWGPYLGISAMGCNDCGSTRPNRASALVQDGLADHLKLANNQGEIVIPATVSGTFQHPVFAPNVQKIAQMKLKNLMPSADKPPRWGLRYSRKFAGQKNANSNQGQKSNTQQQPNPADQILDIFDKKQKQNNISRSRKNSHANVRWATTAKAFRGRQNTSSDLSSRNYRLR